MGYYVLLSIIIIIITIFMSLLLLDSISSEIPSVDNVMKKNIYLLVMASNVQFLCQYRDRSFVSC